MGLGLREFRLSPTSGLKIKPGLLYDLGCTPSIMGPDGGLVVGVGADLAGKARTGSRNPTQTKDAVA